MEQYSFPESLIESEKLRSKISSGEATNYTEAESQLSGAETKLGKSFQERFKKIINIPLTAENIDVYPETALNELISLSATITECYHKQKYVGEGDKELEDAAFKYYGISGIGEVLDYISEKESEIKEIDRLMDTAKVLNSVLVPPKPSNISIIEGNGSYEAALTNARTKTILFILANDFGIDIKNPDQLSLSTGVRPEGSIRKLSYAAIEIPELNRVILCCDEVGNVTYIFDKKALEEMDISTVDLSGLNKPELNLLISEHSRLGKRVRYSDRFVSNIKYLIQEIPEADQGEIEEAEKLPDQYLCPKAPEGVLSVNGMVAEWVISSQAIVAVINELEEDLGEVKVFRFRNKLTSGYTREQQELIHNRLEQRGLFAGQAPEGVLSIGGIAKELGVSAKVVTDSITSLAGILGEVKIYKFGGFITSGYTNYQQGVVHKDLEKKGLFLEQAPEGVLSAVGITKKFAVGSGVVSSAIENLVEALGPTKIYRFRSTRAIGYTMDQQEIIRRYLKERGLFGEEPPKGVLSANSIAKKLHVANASVYEAINAMTEALGVTKEYKFYSRTAIGFTAQQQEIIRLYLEENGHFGERAPEGIMSAKGIAKDLGVNENTIHRAIARLGEQIGETKEYVYGNNLATGFTLEQQQMIRQLLEENGVFGEKAPIGVLSHFGMSKRFGVTNQKITKAIKSLGDSLGETRIYIFGSTPHIGYTPRQQEMIGIELVKKGDVEH